MAKATQPAPTFSTLNLGINETAHKKKIVLTYSSVTKTCGTPNFTWVESYGDEYPKTSEKEKYPHVEAMDGTRMYRHTFKLPVPDEVRKELKLKTCKVDGGKYIVVEFKRPNDGVKLSPYAEPVPPPAVVQQK